MVNPQERLSNIEAGLRGLYENAYVDIRLCDDLAWLLNRVRASSVCAPEIRQVEYVEGTAGASGGYAKEHNCSAGRDCSADTFPAPSHRTVVGLGGDYHIEFLDAHHVRLTPVGGNVAAEVTDEDVTLALQTWEHLTRVDDPDGLADEALDAQAMRSVLVDFAFRARERAPSSATPSPDNAPRRVQKPL